MAKFTSSYICQQCGFHSFQYLGRCPECGTWNSLVETVEETQNSKLKTQKNGRVTELPKVINLAHIEKEDYQRLSTNLEEFDRVLGGGIVLGSVVLVSGDPGVGKSTLLTQLALNTNTPVIPNEAKRSEESPANASKESDIKSEILLLRQAQDRDDNGKVLYVAGEESAQQIKIRVDRIKSGADLAVLNEIDVDNIVEAIREQKPSLVIVDSIQTLETEDLTSVAGSVGQVRECAHRLQRVAKDLHIPVFIVGHVTKEGTVAGPKTLEHLVDVVLSLEGENTSNFRILRATKNRFGPTDEVGIFQMEETGMVEVKNPSEVFLREKIEAPGSAVAITMTGLRPILVEIQALVTKTSLPVPRRTGSGIDNNRLQLLVAVLSKRLGLPLFDQDVFVNVTGGMRLVEPAVDLAICLAIISSFKNQNITPKTAFVGEVGLLGELRSIRQINKRVAEAKKLGFTQVISCGNTKSLSEALKIALR
ncbi:MAG: DNA repair protein RadA [Patescibacteria group bacterium]|nr:DNA repair protein RadA [Patescibacteria group bacterium]